MSHNRDLSAAAAQIGFHSSNIGIGTDAPSETITLNHANGASIGLEYDGTENGTINVNSAAMYARAGSGKHLILGGNATESLRLTSGGDIGIANASPRAKLDIEDAGTSKDVILRVSADDTNPYALVVANDTFNTTSNRGFAFWVGGNKVHHIEARTSTTNSENEIMISAGDAITFRTNVSEERFRINGDGNIGIGDASPTKPLTVGTTTPVILLDDQSSRTLEIRGPSATHNATVLTTSTHDLLLGTNNTERLRIISNGIVQLATDAVDFANGTGYITAKGSGDLVFRTTNSYTERLRIDNSGRVTTPSQPLAVIGTTQNNPTPSAGSVVQFDYAATNRGNHYNTSNYTFTCPVAGDYMVILRHSRKGWVGDLDLQKNGTTHAYLELRETGLNGAGTPVPDWQAGSYSFIVPCAANDVLRWVVGAVYTSTGSGGYLLDGYNHIKYDAVTYYLIG